MYGAFEGLVVFPTAMRTNAEEMKRGLRLVRGPWEKSSDFAIRGFIGVPAELRCISFTNRETSVLRARRINRECSWTAYSFEKKKRNTCAEGDISHGTITLKFCASITMIEKRSMGRYCGILGSHVTQMIS